MAGQFKFVAVIQMVGCEPVKVVVCPEYAVRFEVARLESPAEATVRIVDIEPHWAVTMLHTETVEDADGQ